MSRARSSRWRMLAPGLVVWAATFALYALTTSPTLTWEHDGADGGDLLRAAVMGGVPHPTGYPTYLLAARLFLLLPFGTEAYRMNLLSGFFSACAAALFYGLALSRLPQRDSATALAPAILGSLVLASSSMVWSQAVITEVHGLQLFFVVSLLLSADIWDRHRHPAALCMVGVLAGLGLGNHLTLALLAPGLLILLAPLQRRGIALLTAGLTAGLLIYLYLLIGAYAGAESPWGRLDTPARLAAHVSAELYRGYLFAVTPSEFLARAVSMLKMLLSDFQMWGIALAVLGLVAQRKRDPRWTAAMIGACAVVTFFAAGYGTADASRYLMPVWVCVALWYATGVGAGLDAVQKWSSKPAAAGRLRTVGLRHAPIVLVLLLLLTVAGFVLTRFQSIDLSRNDEAEQFAVQTLSPLPPNAILVSNTDRHTFALWYFTDVRRLRPDVIVVDRDLFNHPPYRDYLKGRWAGLAMDQVTFDQWIAENHLSHPAYETSSRVEAHGKSEWITYAPQ